MKPIGRLLPLASQDTGQARRVADFLLAWHNAEENGCWDPVDLWSVDAAIADDMLVVLGVIR
jgi:ParB family chromosome partitioning protein